MGCRLRGTDLKTLLSENTHDLWGEEGHSVRACSAALPGNAGRIWSTEIGCGAGIDCRLARLRLDRPLTMEFGGEARLPLTIVLTGELQGDPQARARTWSYPPNRVLLRAAHPYAPLTLNLAGGQELELLNFWVPGGVFAQLATSGDDHETHALLAAVASDDGHVIADVRPSPELRLAISQLNRPFDNSRARMMYLQSKASEVAVLLLNSLNYREVSESERRVLGPAERARIERAHEILVADIASVPTVAELARQVHLGETTLKRGFRILYKQSIYAYVQTRRLEHARSLLNRGDIPVSRVARAVGYTCLGRFGSAFRAHFGVRPSDVRRVHRGSTLVG